MSYDKVKKWRKETKARLVEAFGGKCGICNYSKCIEALEFHHLEPSQKDFSIAHSIKSWDKILKEIIKCICVCCRCHREIHYGLIEIPRSIPKFDPAKIVYSPQVKEFDDCPVCGKSKEAIRKTCSPECSGKYRSKISWSTVNLSSMIEAGETFSSIGRLFGVSGNSVKKQYLKQLRTVE